MPVDRVLIDTNVLISGAIYGGSPFVLLELGRTGAVKLLIPDCVVEEAREVLARKFPQSVSELDALLNEIDYESVPDPTQREIDAASKLLRDADDAIVLASILNAAPDFAITGDKDLLTDDVRAVAPVCRCADYLSQLRADD